MFLMLSIIWLIFLVSSSLIYLNAHIQLVMSTTPFGTSCMKAGHIISGTLLFIIVFYQMNVFIHLILFYSESDPTKGATPVGVDVYEKAKTPKWDDYGPYGLLLPVYNISGKGYFHCFGTNLTAVEVNTTGYYDS